MNPDDLKKLDDWFVSKDADVYSDTDFSSNITVDISDKLTAYVNQWDIADSGIYPSTIQWNIAPDIKWDARSVDNDDELCISNFQEQAHRDYPGLKQIWDEYVLMYKLVKGKEPGDDVI